MDGFRIELGSKIHRSIQEKLIAVQLVSVSLVGLVPVLLSVLGDLRGRADKGK